MDAVHYKGYNLYSDTDKGGYWTKVYFYSSDDSIATVTQVTGSDPNLAGIDLMDDYDRSEPWVIQSASPEAYGRVIIYFYASVTVGADNDAKTYTYSGAVMVTILPTGLQAVPMVAAGKDFNVALKGDGTVGLGRQHLRPAGRRRGLRDPGHHQLRRKPGQEQHRPGPDPRRRDHLLRGGRQLSRPGSYQ
jgi:hypothetical protein